MIDKTPIGKEQCKDAGLALTLIGLLAAWFTKNDFWSAMAIPVLILAMTWPGAFKPFAGLWFGLAHLMGEVVSRVLLSVVFFLVLTPMALVRKWSGKDSMGLKLWQSGDQSVFKERGQVFQASDLEKPF